MKTRLHSMIIPNFLTVTTEKDQDLFQRQKNQTLPIYSLDGIFIVWSFCIHHEVRPPPSRTICSHAAASKTSYQDLGLRRTRAIALHPNWENSQHGIIVNPSAVSTSSEFAGTFKSISPPSSLIQAFFESRPSPTSTTYQHCYQFRA